MTGVDRAMVTLDVGTTATAVVARLEQTEQEARRGVRRLVWSNAGHPPPVLLTPRGEVSALQGRSAELLLGVLPDVPRGESVAELEAGSTVLLHTDGLVERRGEALEDGFARLARCLEELAPRDLPLDALCDAVLDRMLPQRPEDDVALLAVRLHPQG
ncbi:PP2C family protein-serine/threonine phosphatase [Kineococcus sp. SYSU DK002]|uniref:PP2C family protein-serine/threonine phosphatase n=1 Tax=Kineococcus sp. SYSU DK002 TaxID=3383123 RepID=UPI003D7EC58B